MLTPNHQTDILAYLASHGRLPEEYIVDSFADHDVVLLGEVHGVRHFVELVHNLIPRLYAAGVRNVGMEFGAVEDQEQLDRLVQAEEYDEKLARRLMFSYNVGWAYREYMDAFGNRRVGFDTKGSPFESIFDDTSYYATGYPDFTLATLADGYIYEKPFREYQGCTVDEAFLTEENWSAARQQIPDPDWNGRPATRGEYMSQIRAFVDMQRRLADVL